MHCGLVASCVGRRPACRATAQLTLSDERTKTIPWKESVAGPNFRLLYMPFLEYQLKYMRDNVEGLKELPFEEHLALQKSKVGRRPMSPQARTGALTSSPHGGVLTRASSGAA